MPAKILVAEDDVDAREMLRVVFENEGFSVITAEDGQAALRLAATERPDLIVTDIEMPNLDGIQMIIRLREFPESRRVPILILSAYQGEKLADAIEAGANQAMQKPVQLGSLVKLVKHLLVTLPQ